ncbi:ABC transporter ATP-binding protein [Jiangella asiatica]|uniref:ABC transporter ATP-binding protein n=2 Tax=Jiangella asiatica TaxID=2530372 RepID=A0A4R5DC25_9ACTN|nr:ABC transporter ATP-binding protein [Jiangella asiatica]
MNSGSDARDDVILEIRDLEVTFHGDDGSVQAADRVSFTVRRGETVAVVGESGSGKSASVLAVLQLLPRSGNVEVRGSVRLDGRELLDADRRTLRAVRGGAVAMIFQDPMTSLNPVVRVGKQLVEMLREHRYPGGRRAAERRAVELLRVVGIPQPELRMRQFPHEFSGGMRQRVMIAMAIANEPSLLIADEPTTALDVTIQAQVLDVLRDAKAATGAAAIVITHDLGVVAELADTVVVMYGGRVVETGSAEEIFAAPRHPYTIGLMAGLPRLDADVDRLVPIPGSPPNLADPPPGCRFHPRCTLRAGRDVCATETPELREIAAGRRSACHFTEEISAEETAAEAARVSELTGVPLTGDGR